MAAGVRFLGPPGRRPDSQCSCCPHPDISGCTDRAPGCGCCHDCPGLERLFPAFLQVLRVQEAPSSGGLSIPEGSLQCSLDARAFHCEVYSAVKGHMHPGLFLAHRPDHCCTELAHIRHASLVGGTLITSMKLGVPSPNLNQHQNQVNHMGQSPDGMSLLAYVSIYHVRVACSRCSHSPRSRLHRSTCSPNVLCRSQLMWLQSAGGSTRGWLS